MKAKEIPEGIDWTQTNATIAKAVGVSSATVWKWRNKCCPDSVRKRNRRGRKPKAIPEHIDWTQSDVAIAKEIGVSRSTVRKWRAKYARGVVYATGNMGRKNIDWELVDFTEPVSMIVKKLGVSLGAVYRALRMLGKKGVLAGKDLAKQRREEEKNKLDWTKTDSELALETGLNRVTVYKWRSQCSEGRKNLGIGAKKKMEFYNSLDWSMRDKALAALTGKCERTIATWRRKCEKGKESLKV